ncbi:hypothetical protein [Spirosoma luteum]|uniref:hypothetical protein n=1 Tax=Spirosoma luteum TaxID=431553 RepID=UPI000370D5D1|nr:hypothetical protein [Spirosoma luteum]
MISTPSRTPFLNALLLLLVCSPSLFGQTPNPSVAITKAFDTYRRQTLAEKLFVHTDQAGYLTGETLWFSIYYVDGTYHKPLDISRVAYLELLDKEGRSVVQTKVALTTGGGNGSLFLPASLRSGLYRMRAYTNWMKNFSADYFFEKNLTIVNPFTPIDPPLPKAITDYDIQFFPEGGNLVQGLASKVAFKVADSTGHGIPVRGWLMSGQSDTLVRFASHKFGMGTFRFTPTANTTYRVLMQDESGRSFMRSLPSIQPQGYVMRLEEAPGDKLTITVSTTVDGASAVYLFAHTRNAIKAAEMHSIQGQSGQGETTFTLDKNVLGEGISHFTVFDASQQPVCERLYFKRPTPVAISLKTSQPTYASRTKVMLDMSVQAPANNSHQTKLSVAVYRLDSLATTHSENILSYLWLMADLSGSIESPAYYLQEESDAVKQATDNLMLTHGWRRFRWSDMLQNTPAPVNAFTPEINGPIIQGTVTDPVSGKPLSNRLTYLSTPGKPIRLYVSRSDSLGRIRFEMQDFYGTKNIIVQTTPKDSLDKLTITNPFIESTSLLSLPPLMLPESRADQLLSRSVAMQVQSTFWGDRAGQYRGPVVDSTAFYGKPSESYLLDTYTRFPRMEEVLREYVLGVMPRKRQGRFHLDVLNAPYRAIFEQSPLVMIDGVPVFDMEKVIDFSPLKIKQLDVVTNAYLISPALFYGVISFMTYKGDLAGFPLDTRLLKLDYDGLQRQREFYAPRYDRPASRLPDGRTLLYWNPALKTSAQGKTQLDFYTSDQTGTYVVEVNGLTNEGHAGYQQTLFNVKNTPK